MKVVGAFCIAVLVAGWSTGLSQTASPQQALQWARGGPESSGLELGIAGPSSVALKPQAVTHIENQTTSLNAREEYAVELRNVGISTVYLCGEQPTFTITAVRADGRNLDVLAGLGPAGNSLGPRMYSEPIAPGASWSPGAKVPLAIIDARASAGTYTLRARMIASICDRDRKHHRDLTIYSGPITASLGLPPLKAR